MHIFSGHNSDGASSGFGDRKDRFRTTHAPGQIVQGRVLRSQGPGMVWIEVGGQPLLSALEGEPEPGLILVFEILRLTPDIVLRHLEHGPGGVPLAPENFDSQAEEVQLLLRDRIRLPLSLLGWEARRREFIRQAAGDETAFSSLVRLLELQEVVNQILAGRGWLFLFAPWLSGILERSELFLQTGGDSIRGVRWTLSGRRNEKWIRAAADGRETGNFVSATGPLLPELLHAARGIQAVI